MNQVELKPDGSLTTESRSVSENPLQYLGYRLHLAAGCCLRTFFHLMQRHDIFTRLGDFFQVLQVQYNQCPFDGCLWSDIAGLQFSKTLEMIGYPGLPRLEIYHRLQGIGPHGSGEIRHLPLAVLLDMPLTLGPLKHLVFGDHIAAMEFETVYTLFEFIDGLTWALSFHGTPQDCLIRS